MTDDLDPEPVLIVLNEAAGISEGLMGTWRDTHEPPADGSYAPYFRILSLRPDVEYEETGEVDQWGRNVVRRVYQETYEEYWERVHAAWVSTLRPVELRSARGLRRWEIRPNAGFCGETCQVPAEKLLAIYRHEFDDREECDSWPKRLYGRSVIGKAELRLLADTLHNAGQLSRQMLAGGGRLSSEHQAILWMWQRLGRHETLRFSEVGELVRVFRRVEKLPPQCGEPGAFLSRFGRKTGEAGSRAPWVLHEAARDRVVNTPELPWVVEHIRRIRG